MKKIILMVGLLSLSGCATVLSGTTQSVSIRVEDSQSKDLITGIQCIITDPNGAQNVLPSNPGVVNVIKGHGLLVVNCNKAGYKQLNTVAGNSFSGTTLINVLFWPGFIVDGVTGAYKKYPSHYVVHMEKYLPSQE